MMYCDKFVVCVKVNGKILREQKDIIKLPFGTEYSILLKNLNTQRAKVSVYVDGSDVLSCKSLIIGPHEETILEGFLSVDNIVKHKFKFIEKTEQISDYRGDKAEDGLIRVEYAFEKDTLINKWDRRFNCEPFKIEEHHHHYHYNDWFLPLRSYYSNGTSSKPNYNPGDVLYSSNSNIKSSSNNASFSSNSNIRSSVNNINKCSIDCSYDVSNSLNEDGITVKGSYSGQSFNSGCIGSVGETKVIILKLIGCVENKKVEKVITTKKKIVCETCGTRSRSNHKFCPNCGTALF